MDKRPEYFDSLREAFGDQILGALASFDEGVPAAWENTARQLRSMSSQELHGLFQMLESKGYLKVVKDPEGNFALSLTPAGKQRAKEPA